MHVHTPYSVLKNDFGNNFEEYAKRMLAAAVGKDIAVVGVTDYFSIKGYIELMALLNDEARLISLVGQEVADKARNILFLPNIELRSSVIVVDSHGNSSRVNFHVIFSDEISPKIITENFLLAIKFTAESNPSSQERWPLTDSNLEELGKRLKRDHAKFADKSDLFVGAMNAVILHEDVTQVLMDNSSRFKDKYLFCVPVDEDLSRVDWDGQGHHSKKILMKKCHLFFSSNPATRQFGLGKRHPSVDAFKEEFGGLKPCIHGCDAHNYDDLFEPNESRYTWIKADPTFYGLRHVIYEPESRVFIGTIPQRMIYVNQNPTKFIKQINFEGSEDRSSEQVWFSGEIPLNQGLIAIIGNKGSGKSALADILGLLGNSHTDKTHYSFLNRDKFLGLKDGLGPLFTARLLWVSEDKKEAKLDADSDLSSPELIKYIPQSYLEFICSDLRNSEDNEFTKELWEVIFSHVKTSDRLQKDSLNDLIAYLTQETGLSIEQLIRELHDVNEMIFSLEEKVSEDYRKTITGLLEKKQRELEAHEKIKPREVQKPDLDQNVQTQIATISKDIDELNKKANLLAEEIKTEKTKEKNATSIIAAADRLLDRIANLIKQYETFINNSHEDEQVLGIKIADLVTYRINVTPINELKSKAASIKASTNNALEPNISGSLTNQLSVLEQAGDDLRKKLDVPNRNYQNYLKEMQKWEQQREVILGSESEKDSIKGLTHILSSLDSLPQELGELRENRKRIATNIYNEKCKLLSKYENLYSPVQNFIDEHPISKKHGALKFRASIMVKEFIDGLLNMIHQGRVGTFYGENEGREQLLNMQQEADFTSAEKLMGFIDKLQYYLEVDQRDPQRRKVNIKDQLRQHYSPIDVYDFIFGLQYLQPDFELSWLGKPLDKLSPGERGNLLLIFYLLIDTRDVPLIIDQPEENLDNQTIAGTLVPAIKDAKERRQVIMVTHNPNLAVVCDADQIIHASIDKTAGNKVAYTSGSIENQRITQLIVDILEGTKPAFDLRDLKYSILE